VFIYAAARVDRLFFVPRKEEVVGEKKRPSSVATEQVGNGDRYQGQGCSWTEVASKLWRNTLFGRLFGRGERTERNNV